MPYFVYKTINKINQKFYIGVHKSDNIESDFYLGSGKILKYALEKYGIENFEREILAEFENSEDAFKLEGELVTIDLIESGECYNLKLGGQGGWDHLNTDEHYNDWRKERMFSKDNPTKLGIKIFKEKYNNDIEFKNKLISNLQNNYKKGHDKQKELYPEGVWKGRIHTEESKEKMRKVAKERLKDPTKNSSFGTMWITNGSESKKIKKDDEMPEGWYKGRIIN